MLSSREATVHPDFIDKMSDAKVVNESVVVDGNIITGQGLGAAIPFALKHVEIMVRKDKADQIQNAICYKG